VPKAKTDEPAKIRNRVREFKEIAASRISRNPKNWRRHPDEQREAFRAMMDRVGFAGACLVRHLGRGNYELIDGELRLDEVEGKIDRVPCLVLDVTEAEADELLATVDPISAMASYDLEALSGILESTEIGDIEPFRSYFDDLTAEAVNESKPEIVEDEAPEPPADPVTKAGDLWLLGRHRLVCGDCTDAETVGRVMGGKMAQLIHADPPYGMGKEKDGIANDNLYADKLDAFQMAWWRTIRPHTDDNGSAYIWGNAEDLWRLWYVGGLKDSERLTFRNEIAWDKGGGGFGVGTESQRCYFPEERCLFFMLGEQGFNNNADNYWEGWEPIRSYLDAERIKSGLSNDQCNKICGKQNMTQSAFTRGGFRLILKEDYNKLRAASGGDAFKREYDELKREFYATRAYFDNAHDNMTDVWKFSRVTGEDRHEHATPKPVSMMARAIKSSAAEGGVVFDPFLGSGTTLIAAEQLNRTCYGCEISPAYCDVIVQRWENLTGEKAKRAKR